MNSHKPSKTYIISTLLLLVLLATPVGAYLLSWSWHEELTYTKFDRLLYFVTETGSAPFYAAITSIILTLILAFLCYKNRHFFFIFLVVFSLHLTSQVIKTGLKQIYQEPRPYMGYLSTLGVNVDEFYAEKRAIRKLIIQDSLINDQHIPSWLQNHWKHETGYSFPSGHTMFAACWVFLFVGFLFQNKHKYRHAATILITLWAILMMISRLRLGMHFPIDLLTSTLIAYIINIVFFHYLDRNPQRTNSLS